MCNISNDKLFYKLICFIGTVPNNIINYNRMLFKLRQRQNFKIVVHKHRL